MIQIVRVALLILGSVILQITLIARVSVFGSRIDLPLALVVSLALFKGSLYGELAGFSSGLMCDIFSGGPLGIQSFGKALVGYFAGFMRNRFYTDNFLTQSLSSFTITIFVGLVTSVCLSLLADSRFLHISIPGLILSAILNSILVIAVFWILKKFNKS